MNVELKDLAPLLLKKERASTDIDIQPLTALLRGGAQKNERRKELTRMVQSHPVLCDRGMMYRNHAERYTFGLKKAYHYIKFIQQHQIVSEEENQFVYFALHEPLSVDVHRSMFIPTLLNQADEEQQRYWLPLAKNYRIFGAYAQTELGHGSNVQGIETIATFDQEKQEFIIHSPTLTSRKWWPGGLGKTATHAIVHARLFLQGKSVGVQAFIVPIRSLADHQPLPGIEVGDIGPKVGFNAVDNGYCAFDHVRIPRTNMLMRFARVLPDGSFVKPKSDKLVYLTMVQVRAYIVLKMADFLGRATTITTRFSAARIQGRRPSSSSSSSAIKLKEFQVLDYQNQQYKLFPLIAFAFATHFTGKELILMHDAALESIKQGAAASGKLLAQLHGVSSGIKAIVAERVSNGIESCRRLCGGHGFSEASNFWHLFKETVGANTYEGTFDVLVQQHARYLLKVYASSTSSSSSSLVKKTVILDTKAPVKQRFESLVFLFQQRASRLLEELAHQMKKTQNDQNACMVLMSRVSVAHSEVLLLEAFGRGVAKLEEGTATKTCVAELSLLCALSLMVESLGDFEQLTTAQTQEIRHQLIQLLPRIRKNAVLLTDAWDFMDFELNSAIGNYDGDIYRALVNRAKDEPLNQTAVPDGYDAYLKPLIHSGL